MTKLVYVVTAPVTVRSFLRGQLQFLRQHGFKITVISSPGPQLTEVAEQEGVSALPISMEREIALWQDLRSVGALTTSLQKLQPDIVNASTPKAGLLGMVAARLSNIPVRVYQLRGLRMETTTGMKRFLLSATERIASHSAHHVICNSYSLLNRYAELGLAPRHKLRVLGLGSSNGVDPGRFSFTPERYQDSLHIRNELGLTTEGFVFGFVGRLTRDKGVPELIEAFVQLNRKMPQTSLVLVGDYELGDPVDVATMQQIQQHPAIHHVGFVMDTAPYYHLMQVLVFPSHREGFPNAPLEAAMAAVPTVGFDTTGVRDAVQHEQTGLLVPAGSVEDLMNAMSKLAVDSQLRNRLGDNARRWAEENFNPQKVWQQWVDFYLDCLPHRSF